MSFFRNRLPLLAAALLATAGAQAATLLSEGFDDAGSLAGHGWLLVNANPDPAVPPVLWYQPNPDFLIFDAHGGAANSYLASDFGAAAPGTTLANWLITPTFSTAQAGTVTFWLRGEIADGFVDTVRFGFSGGSGEPGQFALGSLVTASGDWTEYSASFAAGAAGSTARFAIEETGPADLADYVGVDDVRIETAPAAAVPEPANWLLLAAGLAALAARRRRVPR